MEELERDLITCEDDAGNEITLEVIDYFFYEGKQYALLRVFDEENPEIQEDEDRYIMEVVPVGDEDEEFQMVPEELEGRLIEMLNSGAFGNDDFDFDE